MTLNQSGIMSNYKYRFNLGDVSFYGDSDEEIIARIKGFYISRNIDININEYIPLVKKGKKTNNNNIKNQLEGAGPAKKNKSFDQVLNGAKAIIKNEAGMTASQEEINRRAKVCTNCPLLSDVTNCKACGFGSSFAKWMKKSIKALLPHRKESFTIPNSLADKYCSFCSCSLFVVLPSEMNNFKETNSQLRPENCWINPESPNYLP